jgi:hypothetical protein
VHLRYDASSDALLVLGNDTVGNGLAILDGDDLVDQLTLDAGLGAAFDLIEVTGDLDAFTGADTQYAQLRVVQVEGTLLLSDGSGTLSLAASDTVDLRYTVSGQRLELLDYANATDLDITDASDMLDDLQVAGQSGKAIDAIALSGDLDSFVGADADFGTLEVSAVSGPLTISDGVGTVTVSSTANVQLRYDGSADSLRVLDYVDAADLNISDGSGLLDSLSIDAQGGKALGSITVTGDLDAFTAATSDYASLHVTAASGALVVDHGGSSFTVTPSAAADLSYDAASGALVVHDFGDSSTLSVTDANGLVDALTITAQGGKSLGAVTVTGDLDAFTGSDTDYTTLQVTAASGALVISDGSNSFTVTPSAAADLSYTGSSDTLVVNDYTDASTLSVTDANDLVDGLTITAQGGKSLGAVTVTGDLVAFTGADGDYTTLQVTAASGALVISDGGNSFTVNSSAAADLSYTGSSDTLVVNDYTDSSTLVVTDANDLVDGLTITAQGGKCLGAVTVTGDLDAFTGADTDYTTLQVTAATGALVISDGSNSFTVNPSAAADLSYTGSSDTLVVNDYTDSSTLSVTDASDLVDGLTITAQGGKSLDAVTVAGDLDAFTGSDADYTTLQVTAASGALVMSDGSNSFTVNSSAAADLSYTGSSDTLVVNDYTDSSTLSVTDASDLVDGLTITAQGGKSLDAVTVAGDLDAFTGSDADYTTLQVTAASGALVMSDGSNSFTVNSSAAADLSYTGSSDTLVVNDYTDSSTLVVTDANDLVDALTITAQGGKSLGGVTVTGDLDAFTGADGDYTTLQVTAASGALVISDGSNSFTVNPSAAADLSYTGSSDTLVVNDYTDSSTLSVTDASDLVDGLTITAQGGKSLGAVTVTGDLDAFTGADADYTTLQVTAASGALVISDGSNSFAVNPSAAADLSYTGSSDTLVVNDYTDSSTLVVTDANDLVDGLTITAQGGKSFGPVTVTGDLDAFTGADTDYTTLQVTVASGALVISDGSNSFTVNPSAAADLSYTGSSDTLLVNDYTDSSTLVVTDANDLVDGLTITAQGGKSLGAVTVTGDLDAFTGADADYTTLQVTAASGALVISDGSNSFTVNPSAAADLSYTGSSDTLVVNDYTDSSTLVVTDANDLVDALTITAQGGKSLGAVTVTGDLDAFTGSDTDYTTLQVTAASGALVISDGSNSFTVNPSAAADLSYTGSSETLVVNDYTDSSTLVVTDANDLVDALTITAQGGKSLGTVTVTGDLDAFTGSDTDYTTLQVTAASGALVISNGSNSFTVNPGAAADLSYTGSSDTLVVNDYTDSSTLVVTDANDLVDALTITAQGGKSLGAVTVTGDLDAFTGSDTDYTTLQVTAASGALVISDGSNSFTVTPSAAADLSYTGSSDTLVVNDYTDSSTLSVTDANDLVDALTITAQGGKSLGAVTVTGDLDAFTGADTDYTTLQVTAASGALVISDGSNSFTVNPSAAADLSYTGSSDTLVVNDYTDSSTLSVTDASDLVDGLTITAQGGKSLGTVTVTGDLDAFTGSDTDYTTLQVTAASGPLVISDGSNSFTVNPSAAADLSYTGSSDTLVVNDYTDSSTLSVTDANDLVDGLTITAQGGKSLGAVTVTGDLDAFTGSDTDYTALQVTAANGPLVISDGSNSFAVNPSAAADLSYTGSSDTLVVNDYTESSTLSVTDASDLVDGLTITAQGGKSLDAVTVAGDLDAFTGSDADYTTLQVTAASGPLVISDGSNSFTVNPSAAADLSYTGSSDTLVVNDYTDSSTLSVTDANDLVDGLTITAQGGKSLDAVTVAGDLDAFTGSDADYTTLQVTAASGPLVISDGSNSFTVNPSAAADLSYTGSSDTLVVNDYTDSSTLSVTDANDLVDGLTITAQGGKSLSAVTVTGDLEAFTGSDTDYTTLQVTAASGPLVISDGSNSFTVNPSAAADLSYTGSSDTLVVNDYTDASTLSVTDANDLVDGLTITAQGGNSLGAVTVTGDLDAFTGSDTDYTTLQVTAANGALVISDGSNSFTVNPSAAADLSYTASSDTLVVNDYTDSSTLVVTDANDLVDALTITAQGGKSLDAVTVAGDLDAFTGSDADYTTLQVTAASGPLVISDGSNSFTVNPSAATDLSYTGSSDTLVVNDYTDSSTLVVTDPDDLVDRLALTGQTGRQLGAITIAGDLDSFASSTSAAFSTLRVSSFSGAGAAGLEILDGALSRRLELGAAFADITYSSASFTGTDGSLEVHSTSGTGAGTVFSVQDLSGNSLRLSRVELSGRLESFVTNGELYDLHSVGDLESLEAQRFAGTIQLDQVTTLDGGAGRMLSFSEAGREVTLDVRQPNAEVALRILQRIDGNLTVEFSANNSLENIVDIFVDMPRVQRIAVTLDLRPVFANLFVTGLEVPEIFLDGFQPVPPNACNEYAPPSQAHASIGEPTGASFDAPSVNGSRDVEALQLMAPRSSADSSFGTGWTLRSSEFWQLLGSGGTAAEEPSEDPARPFEASDAQDPLLTEPAEEPAKEPAKGPVREAQNESQGSRREGSAKPERAAGSEPFGGKR